MLHQSPTLSSARAAGHLMLLKLVRCMMIATTGVTIITQVNRLRPSHITFEDRARRTPMIESLRYHLAPVPKIDSVIRPLSAAASWCAASNGGADGSMRGRTPFEFARSSACITGGTRHTVDAARGRCPDQIRRLSAIPAQGRHLCGFIRHRGPGPTDRGGP
jgi:hypothetical protein